MSDDAQNDKTIARFLEDKKVLLVDADATTRTTSQRMLTSLGVKNKDIYTAWSYHDALKQIETLKPQIVLSDFVLDRHSGIDLLNLHKRVLPNRLETIFIFVSSRNSNTIACLAAAEEVDAFLIKPFSFISLKDKFVENLTAKAYAPDYLKLIEQAKEAVREKRYDDALKTLGAAKRADTAPALACFLEGFVRRAQGNATEAERCYEQGLRHNPVHYRSLGGLLELLIARKAYDQAYEVAHKLTQNYPIEPTLIPVLIRLSIASKNFDDIVRYYDIFEDLEERDPTIVNYVSAGLIICGKYFLETGRHVDGLNALAKAEGLSERKPQIMKEILTTLLGAGLEDDAAALLERCPPEVRNSPEVNAAKLEKVHGSAPPSRVLKYAMDLLAANIKHPRIYEIALLRSVELMQREAYLRQLLEAACRSFPDKRALFEEIVKPLLGGAGEPPRSTGTE